MRNYLGLRQALTSLLSRPVDLVEDGAIRIRTFSRALPSGCCMQRDLKAYLWDFANATESVRAFSAGRNPDTYLQDELRRAAVKRKFGLH
jgi:hypothetical protein